MAEDGDIDASMAAIAQVGDGWGRGGLPTRGRSGRERKGGLRSAQAARCPACSVFLRGWWCPHLSVHTSCGSARLHRASRCSIHPICFTHPSASPTHLLHPPICFTHPSAAGGSGCASTQDELTQALHQARPHHGRVRGEAGTGCPSPRLPCRGGGGGGPGGRAGALLGGQGGGKGGQGGGGRECASRGARSACPPALPGLQATAHIKTYPVLLAGVRGVHPKH